MKKYTFLEHTADVKFQAFGKSLAEAFSNSVLALRETIAPDIEVKTEREEKFNIEGGDNENLLYNLLEEFLFLLDAENFLVSKIKEIKIANGKAKVVAIGDDTSSYEFNNPVKAITYNDMFVKNEGGSWIVQAVLDV